MAAVTARVVFGVDSVLSVGAELEAIGAHRPLVVTTPGRAGAIPRILGALDGEIAGVFDRAAIHVPVERVREAVAAVDRLSPDVLLAVGGGSAVGLAKAVALERRLPIAALPTTYSGSEMTGIWGITDGDQKRTGRDPIVAPRLVLYDPVLTLSMPAEVSAASGMNALAHAVEAVYAANVGPAAAEAADEAIQALARALPRVVTRLDDIDARTLALRGAHRAGVALELASMGLHHKICHVLGGTFGLPHALTHAIVLPHVVAFNAPAAPEAMARIAAALGASDAADSLRALNRRLGLTKSLGDLGLRVADLDRAADLIAASSYDNPRAASAADVRNLLAGALGR